MKTERIDLIRELMLSALRLRQITEDDAQLLVDDYLGAQLEEKFTHGLGKFLLIDAALQERRGVPRILRGRGAVLLVDGNRELGHLAARFCIGELRRLVDANGIGAVGLFNASRYSRLSTYGAMLARSGLVGLVLNNGGPPAVTPEGGIDPIFGTNPICFAFPTEEAPLVFDFSTSRRVWGEIRQATLEGRDLPAEAFLDKDGRATRKPEDAEAVLPFGGHKGYALCFAIEVLAGALVSAKMGLDVADQYDLGFLFVGIDPEAFGVAASFAPAVSRLVQSVRTSRGTDAGNHPRIPGDGARTVRLEWERRGEVLVDGETIERLREMSKSFGGGLSSSAKLD